MCQFQEKAKRRTNVSPGNAPGDKTVPKLCRTLLDNLIQRDKNKRKSERVSNAAFLISFLRKPD